MLFGVALHDELAELRAEVGPQAFDDPVAFRAAFDDFVPEGSATTGEVSLLVGAIATGALQRLVDQVALGADPEISIAVQADLLARDRGTSESSGARWALSVLAHAIGVLPAQGVPTRPTPGPDSIGTADRPGGPANPEVLDPDPTPGAEATRVVSPAPPESTPPTPPTPLTPSTPGDPDRRGVRPLLVGALVVIAVVTVVVVAMLVLRDGDPPEDDVTAEDTSAETTSPTGQASPTSLAEEVLAQANLRVGGNPFRLVLLLDGTNAALVLEAGLHGELGQVDRIPAGCPYLEDSYGAVIEPTGGSEFLLAWRTRDDTDYVEYGEVLAREELVNLSGNAAPCPTPN